MLLLLWSSVVVAFNRPKLDSPPANELFELNIAASPSWCACAQPGSVCTQKSSLRANYKSCARTPNYCILCLIFLLCAPTQDRSARAHRSIADVLLFCCVAASTCRDDCAMNVSGITMTVLTVQWLKELRPSTFLAITKYK